MASGDTPTGTNEAFRKRQEKLGSATMVLSVGNKGSAPHQEEFLSSLSKSSVSGGSSSKKTKAEAKTKALGHNLLQRSHHTISAAPDLMNGLGSQSNGGLGGGLDGFQTPSGLMAPRKAGFKPIAAQKAVVLDQQQRASAASLQAKSRISIGLNGTREGKRKADDEPDPTLRNKRTG